ncbi:hypothetical protein Afil01_54390 [Actinorhabdospora filicis]|uniref:Uncharacterized protein n=1 Tax=Actinorhabdospora filicis TaxID=1785913 RepID=A0A9W6W5Q3_9ACTN|nr:hypothetical protein Afil01_54390 [Actinorhabdospora filicis]
MPAAGVLAASWAVPCLTHLIGVDWLLPPLMVLAVASVLRTGRSLLDRIMVSVFVTAAGIIVFGLVYSAWPWGLSPIAIAGTWFSGLTVIAVLTGRRPSIPTRLLGTDVLVLAALVVGGLWARWPVLGKPSLMPSLVFTSAREDFFRHFSLFDAIVNFGGYPLFNEPEVQRMTADMDVYPPGAHFLYAVLDVFARSSTAPGDAETQLWHYYGYTAIGFGVLCAAIVWAARWVAGPSLAGWRRTAIMSVVAVLVVSGPLTTLFWQGYDSEIVGLALLAVTFAVLLRPAASAREWITLVALMAAATVITYNLFVLFLPAAAVAAVWLYRKRLAPIWKFTVAAVALSGLAASFVFWQQLMVGLGPSHTNEVGGIVPFDRPSVVGLSLLVLAAVLTRTGRRIAVWPIAAVTVAVGLAILLAFAVQQLATFGETRYYLEKLVHVVYVLALAGFGALGLFLKPWRRLAISRRADEGALSIAAVMVMVIGAGLIPLGPVIFTASPNFHAGPNTTWARGWTAKKILSPFVVPTRALLKSGLLDGSPTLVIYSDDGHLNRHVTMFAGILDRDTGTVTEPMEVVNVLDWLGRPALDSNGVITGASRDSLNTLEGAIRVFGRPLRVIVADKTLAAELAAFSTANPDLKLRVEHLPEMQLA